MPITFTYFESFALSSMGKVPILIDVIEKSFEFHSSDHLIHLNIIFQYQCVLVYCFGIISIYNNLHKTIIQYEINIIDSYFMQSQFST